MSTYVDAARLLLDVACQNGHVDATRLLLDRGAAVDKAEESGWTPLSIAKDKGHSSLVALLEAHRK